MQQVCIVGCLGHGDLGAMLGRAQPATPPSSKRQSVRRVLRVSDLHVFFSERVFCFVVG